MDSISIINDLIICEVENPVFGRDVSWKLNIKDVVIVGVCNTIVGDDDSDILIFIDKHAKLYFIILWQEITGYSEFVKTINERFNININDSMLSITDREICLYPITLEEKHLFKRISLNSIFKKITHGSHTASGEITEAQNHSQTSRDM
jgi:hypothetical protein